MRKILIAEDEDVIRDFVVINMRRAGYEVTEVATGEGALEAFKASDGDFDIVLLDVMMPGLDGFEVCKQIRAISGSVGIIMLSARTQ
ncbi:MAG: response regulator, partial [Oscillospiraceae bacterium]|nr:response regulator [Oscillospiraceae bacterium]